MLRRLLKLGYNSAANRQVSRLFYPVERSFYGLGNADPPSARIMRNARMTLVASISASLICLSRNVTNTKTRQSSPRPQPLGGPGVDKSRNFASQAGLCRLGLAVWLICASVLILSAWSVVVIGSADGWMTPARSLRTTGPEGWQLETRRGTPGRSREVRC